MQKNKNARREMARKKARLKRNILIIAGAAVLVAVIVIVIITSVSSAMTERYSDGYASVELRPDWTFSAALYHNERFAGTYSKSESDGETLVYFYHNGITALGTINEHGFTIPREWEDGHSHGSILPRR